MAINHNRIRTTISLDADVHDIFKRMAHAGGMSVSRCMGEWLADTSDGAQMVALKMQEARESPLKVMREFQALAGGLQDEVSKTMDHLRDQKKQTGAAGLVHASRAASSSLRPPSSNTGVLVPPSPLATSPKPRVKKS